ncbi:multiple coagulation factor deficiency protein 2 homolog [Toxorhynchites rutilus septentrionalis]|uniref:multiple coagulation factor deficiency protein 2 homolog n=1 Tax=Toxorhynchites rutilus septentrionalis TaxID=329112 RepID=UPI00247A109B|nr:multiple coagulation factor deficiency protein 2 homolog [Toxorhynchites rutilus septentrionalis]
MMTQLALIMFNTLVVSCHLDLASAKGPHHPRGDYTARNKKFDEHLHVQDDHIQQDLKQLSISEDELARMTDEEKNFYFFKLHDSDNNDHLDGLEILHAATHHSDSHVHKLDREDENNSAENAVIEVIDDFLAYADLDQNGLLTYPEYMKAINTEMWSKKVAETTESMIDST